MEAYTELRRTGFDNVSGEYAARDDFFDPKVFQSAVGNFLEKGTVFFKEGERFVRLTAYFAAFDKWKAANPGKAITNRARIEILNRADTLSVNMSRASNSAFQNGIGSLPSQYWSYQLRLAELAMGTRLSVPERARLVFTQMALYGIPVGISSAVAIPFYDDIRQAAMERGINLDNRAIQMLHDGILSTVTSFITGKEYNVSQRYGPGGLQVLNDLRSMNSLYGTDDPNSKSLLEIVIGPGGNTVLDVAKAMGTGAEYIKSLFTLDSKDGPTTGDFVDLIKNVSTANSMLRAWYIYNTGKYMSSSRGVIVDGLTGTDAFMELALGLTPNEVGDTFRMVKSRKEQRAVEEQAMKEAVKYVRQSIQATRENDPKGAETAMKKAKAAIIAGGIRPDQYSDIIRRVGKGNETMFESLQKDFVKKAPMDQRQDRLNNVLGK